MALPFNLSISPQANIDLEDIFDYSVERWSFNQAKKYHNEIIGKFSEISHDPKIGRTYYYKPGNYRSLHVNRHLIFYKVERKSCIIMRILHERMNIKMHLP